MTIGTDTSTWTYASIKPEEGLAKALRHDVSEIIQIITDSGLRGRGGAGFATGRKWKYCAAAQSEKKYIICNADEGEPGTFKDRVILTEFPDLVFEGLTIGARAIGATHGFIYLRAEYLYLFHHLKETINRRRENGLLGENILGIKGFNFDVDVRIGAGAYVCGEESALIESIEGFRGEPRNRPPYPAEYGLGGLPTVVNNVETLAWVPCIFVNGVAWFREVGTDESKGYKLYSVSGDVERPGVYELPMGITVAKLLEQVGGANAKAVQVGGASGRCVLSMEFEERLIAFEDMATGGSVIVIGPGRDMLMMVKGFLEFFVEESCGQCTPCREGNVKLLEGVHLLEQGKCSMRYLKELCRLGETMQVASKCGLGQSSPNAFLSVVEHFKDEIMGRVNLVTEG
ncbi:MAG: NADH-ubiquinone oxidoreductase-F iron-sulfur binding region domain-containing protein [bacterium]